MKTQRRHDLQTNVLADWLGKKLEAIKPYFKSILAVAIAIPAVWIAITLITRQQAGEVGRSWTAYFGAMSDTEPSDALGRVAEAYTGTAVGLWATQSAADRQLSEASMEMFRDPTAAREKLKRAKENYETVEKGAIREPMLRQRAVFGLAQTHESLGELNEARAKYEELAKQASDTAIGKAAARRLAQLVDASTGKLRPEVEKFYAEMAAYTPPLPSVIPRDPSSTFGDGFQNPTFDLDSLPDRPDLSFPGSDTKTPPASTGTTESEQVPSDKEKKPESDQPPAPSPAPANSDDKPPADNAPVKTESPEKTAPPAPDEGSSN
jgi:uncharacterized protein YdbL (DUF1318 family)